jgi:protein ImuB
MRTLCINLASEMRSTDRCSSYTYLNHLQEAQVAEVFLKLSPRVHFRAPHYFFIDIESTAHLFGGESQLFTVATELAQLVSENCALAIADTPYVAQLLSHLKPQTISAPLQDQRTLKTFPLAGLSYLEGVVPWQHKTQIEYLVQFFGSVGLKTLGELMNFPASSFRERWGALGLLVWKKLHQKENQVISPLVSTQVLEAFAHLDVPIENLALLMGALEPHLRALFLRLEGLGRFARKMNLIFYCEYSDKKFDVTIDPISPSRDHKLFTDLLLSKLANLNFENPIRQFEITLFDVPEKVQQLSFFEPRETKEDKWRKLISMAQQAGLKMGFFQIKNSQYPEKSFSLISDWPKHFSVSDSVENRSGALQVKKMHSKSLSQSPRPSLIFKQAQLLPRNYVKDLFWLSQIPVERIESDWWEHKGVGKNRDYYFGLSKAGQVLWIYQDLDTKNYFLQGYFD